MWKQPDGCNLLSRWCVTAISCSNRQVGWMAFQIVDIHFIINYCNLRIISCSTKLKCSSYSKVSLNPSKRDPLIDHLHECLHNNQISLCMHHHHPSTATVSHIAAMKEQLRFKNAKANILDVLDGPKSVMRIP